MRKLTWPAWQRNMWLKRAARPKYWLKKWRARLPKKRRKTCASSKTRYSVFLNRSRLSKTAAAVISAVRRGKRKAVPVKACKARATRVASSRAALNRAPARLPVAQRKAKPAAAPAARSKPQEARPLRPGLLSLSGDRDPDGWG